MIDISKIKIGAKVHYIPYSACPPAHYENGMVKEIPEHTNSAVRVVYHCGGDWNNFMVFTSLLTNIDQLNLGWHHS